MLGDYDPRDRLEFDSDRFTLPSLSDDESSTNSSSDRDYAGHAYRGVSRTAFLASAAGLVISTAYRVVSRVHWDDDAAEDAAQKHRRWKHLSRASLGLSAVTGALGVRHRVRRFRSRLSDRVRSRF